MARYRRTRRRFSRENDAKLQRERSVNFARSGLTPSLQRSAGYPRPRPRIRRARSQTSEPRISRLRRRGVIQATETRVAFKTTRVPRFFFFHPRSFHTTRHCRALCSQRALGIRNRRRRGSTPPFYHRSTAVVVVAAVKRKRDDSTGIVRIGVRIAIAPCHPRYRRPSFSQPTRDSSSLGAATSVQIPRG